jgi:hypothetical protein
MTVTIDPDAGITTPALVNTGTTQLDGNVTLGSSLLATPSGSAPSYTCRAWVNFDGTGTVAIRASGNVTGITDNGAGQYKVNLTTTMPDVNYSLLMSTGVIDRFTSSDSGANTGSQIDVRSTNLSATYTDIAHFFVAIFR